jgi:uncharacterized protein (TIGR00730 family)
LVSANLTVAARAPQDHAPLPTSAPSPLESVCVFCGASPSADERLLRAAADLGQALAAANRRLIYGGGGFGLMGACARSAHAAGGRVLGVMPDFLHEKEGPCEGAETRVVGSMRERKDIMFAEADAFVVLPGGLGTLEEAIEVMSWRRLGLHAKPVVLVNLDGFWDRLLQFFDHTVERRLNPAAFYETWAAVAEVDDVLPALARLEAGAPIRV